MNSTKIRRTTALVLLVLLIVATTCRELFAKRAEFWFPDDWFYIFCLTHTILLASCAVYGPGKFVVRIPFVVAWGLASGFALSTANLISTQGRSSLLGGAILIVTGTLPPLIIFTLHRWRTDAAMTYGISSAGRASPPIHQFSLQTLMILTAAFAVTGAVARVAMTVPADPYGASHDTLVLHAWLGFFPRLAATPVWLVVFRPSWKIVVLASCSFVVVSSVNPFLLAIASPYIFENTDVIRAVRMVYVVEHMKDAWIENLLFDGQTAVATVVYALLARAAGFRMVVPNQSNDKNPNPSGEPATEAGCVQD